MPNTVPNQRLVAIHRERASSDFLGIKNSHWQAAARDLGAHALMLYLWQYRIMEQVLSPKDFVPRESVEKAGILDVFPFFHTAQLGQKIRRKPQSPLCGVALYFASNANGFMLALSPAAIRQAVGMPSSTYRDQFVRLVDKGYLVQRGDSNTYDFYETPQRAMHTEKDETDSGYETLRQTLLKRCKP